MLDPARYLGTYTANAGQLCLDFVNTLSWPTSKHPEERLLSYTHLVAWSLTVKVVTEEMAQALMQAAGEHPSAADAVLERALVLREALYRIFSISPQALPVEAEDLFTLNDELSIAFTHLKVFPIMGHYTWIWDDSTGFDRMLWSVSRSSADLLVSKELARVGECQGIGCGWLFWDTSKNHSRRWCDMNDCGNRAKARRFYRRKMKQS